MGGFLFWKNLNFNGFGEIIKALNLVMEFIELLYLINVYSDLLNSILLSFGFKKLFSLVSHLNIFLSSYRDLHSKLDISIASSKQYCFFSFMYYGPRIFY